MKRAGVVVAVLAACVALDFLLPWIVPDSSVRQLLMLAACNVLVALSLNVINGLAGQFSIGHAGFLGIGGYTSAVLASHLHAALGDGEPTFARSFVVVPVCLLASALFAGLAGLVVGLALLLGVVAWRMKFSGWGRALRALREDEIAAASVGVDPTRYKVTSFVLAAAFAGIAGGLMAIMRDGTPVVNPDSYGFAASFDAITMVILGGSGSVTGAALGGVFITFSIKAIELVQALPVVQALKDRADWLDLNALRMIVYACVLVGLMILRPEGLLGERELFGKRTTR